MESTMGLSTDYSYLFTSADALQSCLSCNDIKANCEYAMENMQKASDQLKQHKDNQRPSTKVEGLKYGLKACGLTANPQLRPIL